MPGLRFTLGLRQCAPATPGAPHADFRWAAGIREASRALENISDGELRRRFDACRDPLSTTRPPHESSAIARVFTLVDQAAWRTLALRFYDVQFVAALALAQGRIAEMATGEGKTLVAALAAAALAAAGRSVHVVTANSYLAARDRELLSPLYERLGLRAALLPETPDIPAKRAAYRADVVYATGSELGFDYLRDQLTLRQQHAAPIGLRTLRALQADSAVYTGTMRRGEDCVVIDEADHVLLDEANSALLLSEAAAGPATDAAAHRAARDLAALLQRDADFSVSEATQEVRWMSPGLARIHASDVAIPEGILLRPWSVYVEQALRARWLLRRDVHYVVREGRVCIVHEATGRILESHLWQDGLHQAVEAAEGLEITAGSRTAARISRQRFFQRYRFLSGMTGTATGVSEAEFREFYQLSVTTIPRRVPCLRRTLPPRFFADQPSKWAAIAADVARSHRRGQPVLVGTRTIAGSEAIAAMLQSRGVPHALLNGKQDAAEAEIIAKAGERGAVTVATNMAGRGTDIRLGAGVAELGGLHVVLSEPHESTRVDRQLLGRSARQGDPGSAQSYGALDDELIARAAPRWAAESRQRAASDGTIPIDLAPRILNLQDETERAAFRRRRALLRDETQRDTLVARFHNASPSHIREGFEP